MVDQQWRMRTEQVWKEEAGVWWDRCVVRQMCSETGVGKAIDGRLKATDVKLLFIVTSF